MSDKEIIAKRVAQELKNGDVVNLGIGLPTMVADYVPASINIILQSENGMLGMGEADKSQNCNLNITNAGGKPVKIKPNGSFFDSSMSFTIIRGGHVDVTVLGALQVDEAGSLASHIIPGKMVPGMGGAMDLVTGSKKVIIAMTHCAKDNSAKIMKKLTLPPTGIRVVDKIITELGVIEVTKDGLVLTEITEGTTVEQILSATDAQLIISKDLKINSEV